MLLIFQTLYLLNYKSQIKQISSQLSFIMEHQSRKFVATQLKPREIDRLVRECNMLLSRQRAMDEQFSRKNQEMNSTIISLSHDIRTPLTSLDGYLQLALRAGAEQEKSQYVRLAQSRIQQIIKLVDELFLYTKLQNPEYVFELQPVEVMEVLKRNLFTFLDDFTRSGEEPELRLPERSALVMGDTNAIERIFSNIIGNYFIHGAGPLSVEVQDRQDTLCIRFTNRLKAGSTVDTEKIFTRFYKEDPSRTLHSSGLGLSIVKALIEKMNGYAEAECTADTFRISIAFKTTGKEYAHVH
ncbi:HAMP domain-containing histidine kinase [Paenibacillus tritici]|uniref:histidine kinase n=1 Tax=Paenibacillus tritici TaxID=1873425 RepID=A0ABX2DJ25_9BACL|nr:HAMP domain-containing sensor histidine kinase [Paenibacillus tritici]NQX44619.1 HAMP domain-containing histidine kinase [Paenibacillus tritici]QUL53683.1 HAMP domain-containing histidine kinase [Paenibacillus tritici]